MRWLWILLPLFLLIACSDDAPQDTPPPSREDDTGASDDLCADGACDLADSRSKHGSRLQVLNQDWIGEDGSVIEQPRGAFDTKYGFRCYPTPSQFDGRTRCYPVHIDTVSLGGVYFFGDDKCEVELLDAQQVDEVLCRTTAGLFATTREVPNNDICSAHDQKRITAYFFVEDIRALEWNAPSAVYRRRENGCEEYSYQDPSDYYILPSMEEYHIPDDDFVEMER